MPKRDAGEAMPEAIGEQANSSWYGFKHYNAGSATDPYIAFTVGYRRGYTNCMEASVYWSGLVEQVHRLNDLLEDLLMTQEAVRITPEGDADATEKRAVSR